MASLVAEAQDRFILTSTLYNDSEKTSRGIYFDRKQQRMVVQTIEWSDSYEKHRRESRQGRYEFPSSTNSLARENSADLENIYGVEIDYDYYPMGSKDDYQKAMKEIGELVRKQDRKTVLDRVKREIESKKQSRYQMLAKGMHENRQIAVYYNPEKGDFVLKGVKRDDKELPVYRFKNELGFPFEVDPEGEKGSKYWTNTDKTWSAKTPGEFDDAIENIIDYFDDYKYTFQTSNSFFSFDKGLGKLKEILDQKKKEFMERSSDFKLVRWVILDEDDDNFSKEFCHKMFFNYKTNEMYYEKRKTRYDRSTKKKVCDEKVSSERVFDLSDERGFAEAKSFFSRQNVYNKGLFDQFRNLLITTACQGDVTIKDQLVPDMSIYDDVLDRIWRDYQKRSLATNMLRLSGRKMSLQVEIKDEKMQVELQLDAAGKIVGVKFDDPAQARKLGLEIEEVRDGQISYFQVKTKDDVHKEDIVLMTFSNEDMGLIEGRVKGKIAVHVKGKDAFEKNVYEFELASNKEITKIGPRQRFDGTNLDLFHVRMAEASGGGFENFMFKTFWSKSGRQRYVRDEVRDKATEAFKGTEFEGMMSRERLGQIAKSVAEDVKIHTRNYTTHSNHISATAARSAMNKFVDDLLPQMLEAYAADEDPFKIRQVVDAAIDPFKKCLDRAVELKNVDESLKCLNKLKAQGPVDIAEGIMQLKLEEEGLMSFSKISSQQFRACLKEKYYPNFINARNEIVEKKLEEFTDSLNVVKGCLFTSVIDIINIAGPKMVDSELERVSEEVGIKLTASEAEKNAAFKRANMCLRAKAISIKTSYGNKVYFDRLAKMDPDEFQHNVFGCVDRIKRDLAKNVSSRAIDEKMAEMKGIDEQVLKLVKKEAMEVAYEQCNDRLEKIVEDAKKRYYAKKEEMKRKGQKGTVPVAVPAFNPANCTNWIMNHTLLHATRELIKSEVGDKNYEKLVHTRGQEPDFPACYARVQKMIEDNLEDEILAEAALSKKDAQQATETRKQMYEQRIAQCLQDGIMWAGQYGSRFIIDKILKEKGDDLSAVKISDAQYNFLGEKIRKCFAANMSEPEQIDAVSNEFNELKDKCGSTLLKDREVQDILIKPVVLDALKNTDMPAEDLDRVSKKVLDALNVKIQKGNKIEEIVQIIEGEKANLTEMVVEEVLDVKLKSFVEDIDDPKLRDESLMRLRKLVKEKVLDWGTPKTFRQRLREAAMAKEGGKKALMDVADAMILHSIEQLAPEIIGIVAADLKKEGIFKTDAEIEEVKTKAMGFLNSCLKSEASLKLGVNERVDKCLLETKTETSFWVTEKILTRSLNENGVTEFISDEDKKRIKDKIISPELKARFEAVFKIKDKEAQEKERDLLTLSLKADIVSELAPVMFPNIVEKFLEDPKTLTAPELVLFKAKKEEVKSTVTANTLACLAVHKATIAKHLKEKSIAGFDPKMDSEKCLNLARKEAIEKILPIKLEHMLNFLTTNGTLHKKYMGETMRKFNSCSARLNPYQKTDDYGNEMEACLLMAIRNFVTSALSYARDLAPEVFEKNVRTDREFSNCMDKADQKLVERFSSQLSSEDKKDQFKLYSKTVGMTRHLRPEEKINAEWYLEEIRSCALSSAAINILREYKNKIVLSNMLPKSHSLMLNHFTNELEDIFELKGPDGNAFRLTFNLYKDQAQGINEQELLEQGGKKGAIDVLKASNEMILNYVTQIAQYAPDAAMRAVTSLKEQIMARIKKNGGTIDIKEINELLANSDLLGLVIEAGIANKIALKTKDSLTEQGVSDSRQKQLTSELMLRRNFRYGERGKAVVDKIRQKFILPLLNGELKDKTADIPQEYQDEIMETLLNDEELSGFVETIFYDIIQGKLTEKRDYIENGFFFILKVNYAVWVKGLNRYDFQWGPPKNLRMTCGGRKAVKAFGKHILRPMMAYNACYEEKRKAGWTRKRSHEECVKKTSQYTTAWKDVGYSNSDFSSQKNYEKFLEEKLIKEISDKYVTPLIEDALENPKIVGPNAACAKYP